MTTAREELIRWLDTAAEKMVAWPLEMLTDRAEVKEALRSAMDKFGEMAAQVCDEHEQDNLQNVELACIKGDLAWSHIFKGYAEEAKNIGKDIHALRKVLHHRPPEENNK